jgi:hypothetical protein
MLPEKTRMTEKTKNRKGQKRNGGTILLSVILAFVIFSGVYISIYYHAEDKALTFMNSDAVVSVSETGYGWFFDGPSEDTALIFYPGAKVEESAYAPLLHTLAEQGIDVCLVKMPFRLACLYGNAAEKVLKVHSYSNWYIGGHSLGGLMAAEYATANSGIFSGVILLGAYQIKTIPEPLTEIQLIGTEDRVVNRSLLEKGRAYAPSAYVEHVIQGGNHAQFGSYGKQRGDGTALISADEQVQETVSVIVSSIFPQE